MQVSLSYYLSKNWFQRYKLGERNAMRIPNMSREQVERANRTKRLPDNYWLMTKEKDDYDQNGKRFSLKREIMNPPVYYPNTSQEVKPIPEPVMTIIKGNRVYTKDFPQFYKIVPEGYEIEKNIFGTFLKKSNVKSAAFNYFQPTIYTSLGVAVSCLFSVISKKFKH